MMAPVRAGMCLYESLLNGTLDLSDIALMNETLEVENENEYRAIEASRKKR